LPAGVGRKKDWRHPTHCPSQRRIHAVAFAAGVLHRTLLFDTCQSLFGNLFALRAASMDPIEALREL
jgi:hypothetical protein